MSRGGGARVKAATVRVRDQFVMARYGRTSRDLYRSRLSAAVLETLTVPGDRWVGFEQFVEATDLACRLFADGSPALAREIGAFGAEANMGVWRAIVYRVLAPQTLMSIAGGLWSHHYDGGRLVVTPEGDRGLKIQLADFPSPHVLHCLSIEGWLKRTLELGRPKSVRVTQRACRTRGDDACEFQGEWG